MKFKIIISSLFLILTIQKYSFGGEDVGNNITEVTNTESIPVKKVESSWKGKVGFEMDLFYLLGLGINVGMSKHLSVHVKGVSDALALNGGLLFELFYNFLPSKRFGLNLGTGIWLSRGHWNAGNSELGTWCFRFFSDACVPQEATNNDYYDDRFWMVTIPLSLRGEYFIYKPFSIHLQIDFGQFQPEKIYPIAYPILGLNLYLDLFQR